MSAPCIRFVLCVGVGDSDTAIRRRVRALELRALERLRSANALLQRRAEHVRALIGECERELLAVQVERRTAPIRRALRPDEAARVRRVLDARRRHTAEVVRCERQSMLLTATINDVAASTLQREVVGALQDGAAATRAVATDVLDVERLIESLAESRDVAASVDEALATMCDATAVDDATLERELEALLDPDDVADGVAHRSREDERDLAAATAERAAREQRRPRTTTKRDDDATTSRVPVVAE